MGFGQRVFLIIMSFAILASVIFVPVIEKSYFMSIVSKEYKWIFVGNQNSSTQLNIEYLVFEFLAIIAISILGLLILKPATKA